MGSEKSREQYDDKVEEASAGLVTQTVSRSGAEHRMIGAVSLMT
jgi:hypothetical protein